MRPEAAGETASASTSDARFRTIFEQSPISMQVFAPDGTMTAANQAWERLWGVKAEQMIGRYNVLQDEQLAVKGVIPYIRRGFAGEAIELPTVKYLPAETVPGLSPVPYRWVRAWLYPILADDGSVDEVVFMLEDVSEQVETAGQLHEREEQYRRIFEATSDGLIINDPACGVVVEANEAVSRMHGYTREEFIGLHATAFIHPDYHPVFDEFVETISAGGSYQTTAIDTRKDGSSFPVEVNGSPVTYRGRLHILAVVRDITERVRAYELLEQRVAERTRELSMLLGVSQDVASTLELQPLLSLILDHLEESIGYTDASVATIDGDELWIIGNRGPLPQELAHVHVPITPWLPLWPVINNRETVILDDVLDEGPEARRFREAWPRLLERVPVRSWMAVPMSVGERVIGILSLSSELPGYYTPHHAALVRGIAQQASIAVENARLYQEAQDVAVLEERQRLARELHDSVSQALYSIVLGIKTAQAVLDDDPGRAVDPIEFALLQAEAGLAEMRALIFELRPEALETEGLAAALEKQASFIRDRHRLNVNTRLESEPDVPVSVKEALYRVAQEALHNTVKHAHARTVDIRLDANQSGIELEVRDDGKGFEPNGPFPGHLGLQTMRERVALLGGKLDIQSAPGRGTLIRADVPVAQVAP